MTNKSKLTTQDILQGAERYLAQTEVYKDVTMQRLADFLGVGIRIVHRLLPAPEWAQLQHTWMLERLKQAIETFCTANRIQEDFTLENVANRVGIPFSMIHRSLTKDELQSLLTKDSITPQDGMVSQEASSASTYYIHQAELYFAQTEKYGMASIKHFAISLGVPVHHLWKHLSTYQWETLRNTWLRNRLRRAMDDAYTEAKTQEDFTLKNIAKHAEMPYLTARRFTNEDEWQKRRLTLPKPQTSETVSRYIQQAEIYLAQTQHYEDVTMKHFAEFIGVLPKAVSKQLSNHQWEQLRNRWIENHLEQTVNDAYTEAKTPEDFTIESIAMHAGMPSKTVGRHLSRDELQARRNMIASKDISSFQRLLQAMDKVYADAKTREDFTISKLVELTGISRKSVSKLIGDEWHRRRETLPTTKEKVLTALETLVEMGIPMEELTRQRVVELADVNSEGTWSWFNRPYHIACRQLALRSIKRMPEPPLGANVRIIPGGWVDIDEHVWDLRPAGKLLQKNMLRDDLADIAWSLLQDELRSPEVALGTIGHHYFGFTKLGTFLGNEILDVRQATLSVVQRLWMNCQLGESLPQLVRWCLVQIFEALTRLAKHDDTINATEMLSISMWLQTAVKIGRRAPSQDFLSESELDAVLCGCLADVVAGITYINTQPDLLTTSVNPNAHENATVIVRWTVALMTLVMVFTGLRRESVLGIKINDWIEVYTDLFVLAWHHNKKGEENVAVLPAALAQLLQMYVHYTTPIRAALETEYVFLANNKQGYWQVLPDSQLSGRLKEFVECHHLERDGLPLLLNSTILRRTYATRAVYEGRDLAALRAQLGHVHFESTLRYVKFDQFEHPAEVGTSLDEYGRKALTLWQKPLILDDLEPDERASLLRVKVKHRQDIGLCRHAQCVKAIQGSPPPCSLCEYLVTGPEFLDAWQAEHLWRKQNLEQLAQEPELGAVQAQMKSQFERFKANFAFVQERIHA